jgi:hypothetical protein
MVMNIENKKYFFNQHLLRNLVKLTIGVGFIFIVYVWTDQSDTTLPGNNNHRRSSRLLPIQWTKENISDEYRIAQHFDADTLPGLMRCGLIKKYERHRTGTILYVAGKVWKGRSRFFKESLLLEAVIYNKVNGYALETRIVDDCSQQLYAHAVSEDRKEFFD